MADATPVSAFRNQVQAEADRRFLVLEPGLNEMTVGLARATRNSRAAFVAGAEWAVTLTREVATVADLDALPVGSVLLTPLGAAEVRDAGNSGGRYLRRFNGADHWMNLLSEQARMLPARLLFEPEGAP